MGDAATHPGQCHRLCEPAAGGDRRGDAVRIAAHAGAPQTLTVGGKTVTLPTNSPDQYALKVTVGTGETVSFSAPSTAGAVYVAQSTGDPQSRQDPTTNDGVTQQQLLKFQTDTTDVNAPPQIPGQGYFVDGRTFADTLGPEVKTVHATQVGSDGSVYMLADITGTTGGSTTAGVTTGGQTIKGTQDVALLKYDSAGKLLYTRTLGAADSATGLGLAVSTDGKVAVTGSLTGVLTGDTEGALNSGATGSFADNTDSFVTLYDANGDETWTARRGLAAQRRGHPGGGSGQTARSMWPAMRRARCPATPRRSRRRRLHRGLQDHRQGNAAGDLHPDVRHHRDGQARGARR